MTHPGSATGGDPEEALRRNAAAIAEALEACPGGTAVLVETTAGSGTALGSRVDRHAHIGEGEIGEAPFAALMRDPRLRDLETPKGDDPVAADRRNLDLLRRLAGAEA